jgi:hypothetical protein
MAKNSFKIKIDHKTSGFAAFRE